MPGPFKLDHMQLIESILCWKIFNFFTFILGGQFLLPQRANNGKREILATSNMDETEGFQCLGHSNWTTCSPLSHFCSDKFQFVSSLYWEAISYYPRCLIVGKEEFSQFQKRMRQWVSSAWGLQTGPLAALCTSHFVKISYLFHFHTGRPILITPEG